MKNKNKSFRADAIGSYFRLEWLPLLFVTLSGLVYNVGLLAGPWYEGRLAQCLADILATSEMALVISSPAPSFSSAARLWRTRLA